jgi:hypothetical protein
MTIRGKIASDSSCLSAGLSARLDAGYGHASFGDGRPFLAHCRNPSTAISTKSRRKGEALVNRNLISRHPLTLKT